MSPSPTPEPIETVEEEVDPNLIVLQPGENTPEPTNTPWPIWTPWPISTRRPGPTATALPLPTPFDSPAGALLYTERTGLIDGSHLFAEGKLYRVRVDSEGKISPIEPIEVGWLRPYFSWDRSLVALVDRVMSTDHISILYAETSNVVKLSPTFGTSGQFTGWSPNNQEILYIREGNCGLCLLNITTNEITSVAQRQPFQINDAAFSPDGQRIVYSQGVDPSELWIVYADGSKPQLLYKGGTIYGISWSPQNERIAFIDLAAGLFTISPDGAEVREFTSHIFIGNIDELVWSPNGVQLAYVGWVSEEHAEHTKWADKDKDPYSDAFINANIYLLNEETGEEHPLIAVENTDGISGHIDPTFSPDGKQIAFAALKDGQPSLWVVNIDGTEPKMVVETTGLIRFPNWTR